MFNRRNLSGVTRQLARTALQVNDIARRVELMSAINKLKRHHEEIEQLLFQNERECAALKQHNQRLQSQ